MFEALSAFFVNPGMLAGLGLVAVPIIIYLINRQRYQRRRWAAMEFLLRAVKRHQRRIQLQNLLLLLLRVAILALLAFALARPIQRRGRVVVAPEGSQRWILAVDTSFSMGYQEGTRTLFEGAGETVARLADVLLKPGDEVALMTMEETPRAVLAPVAFDEEGKRKLLGEVADLELTTGRVDLGAFFSALEDVCATYDAGKDARPKRIVLLSDFQRHDWIEPDRWPGSAGSIGGAGSDRSAGVAIPGVKASIQKIQDEGGEFALAQVSPAVHRTNLAVVDLSVRPSVVATDVWVEILATVRNLGDRSVDSVDLTIQVDVDPDDPSRESQTGDVIRVPAGGSVTRVLPYRFASAGYHTVVAEIRSDGLLIDNRRSLALQVAEDVRVLLVDGDPAASPIDRETFHLEVALEPGVYASGGPGRFTPFVPEYISLDQIGGLSFQEYAVVILANVAELPGEKTEALKAYVRGGGALMSFLGPNVRPEFYNRSFGDDGLLPGRLEEPRGDPRYPVYLEVSDPGHPVARYFEEHRETTHLHRPIVAFGRYYRVAGLDAPRPGVRVPFRFTDSPRSPAVFDVAYGEGRALWVATTADQEWNEFSSWPDFVVFVHESLSDLVESGSTSANLRVGETFRRLYPSTAYASEVILRVPDLPTGDLRRSRTVRKAMSPVGEGGEFEIVHEDTEAPGIYRLDLNRGGVADADTVEYFGVNVDTAESDLRSMTDDDFQGTYENLRYQAFDVSERIRKVAGERELLRGREYWKWLLFAVMGLAAAELVLAYLFGRRAR